MDFKYRPVLKFILSIYQNKFNPDMDNLLCKNKHRTRYLPHVSLRGNISWYAKLWNSLHIMKNVIALLHIIKFTKRKTKI